MCVGRVSFLQFVGRPLPAPIIASPGQAVERDGQVVPREFAELWESLFEPGLLGETPTPTTQLVRNLTD